MKQFTLLFIALITSSSFYAQVTITHNNSQTVVPNTSIACANSFGIAYDNHYYGVFDLENDFGITEDWQITAVETGIEDADNLPNGTFPLYISAYTTDDNTPLGNLTFLGGDTMYVTNDDELTVVSLPFSSNVILPAGATLVIKIETYGDGQSIFRIGATNIASNDDTWGEAPDCGVSIPQTFAVGGFENVWNILNVVGDSPTGLNEILSRSVMTYPNPTTGLVNVETPDKIEVLNTQLFDLLGNEISVPYANKIIDLSAQANGMYFLLMQTSEGNLSKSIVKE